jgi:L-ribulose-5-phosphate 4-epimerase
MSAYKELKERAWLCNMELPQRGLVIYTFGNASAADRLRGVFAIKPSGVPYENLKAEDMVVVDFENNVIEGSLKYSSDTKTHTVLYNSFPEINGVVHTHATYSVAWAQTGKPIPVYGTTHADHCADDIPCTAFMTDESIARDYEVETGYQIVNAFKNISYKDIEMVLVAGHGPFTWGSTPEKAVYNSVILEELSRMAAITRMINPATDRLKQTLVDKHYFRKHGAHAYYGQNEK